MFLELALVHNGLITADQFVQAVEYQLAHRPRFGRLALESGKLTMKQVFTVLKRQTETDKPFGETAVELGYLTTRQVNNLLKQQTQRTLPLWQCLIEIGAVDQNTIAQTSGQLRCEQTGTCRPGTTATARRPNQSPVCAAEQLELATC